MTDLVDGWADRMQQTVDPLSGEGGETMTYTLDLNPSAGSRQARTTSSGQALARITQQNTATLNNIPEGGTDYFLGDAPSISLRASFGSVRQMADEIGV